MNGGVGPMYHENCGSKLPHSKIPPHAKLNTGNAPA